MRPIPRCRHCHDDLPADCPPDLTSCRAYADWRSRSKGDLLPGDEADDLMLYAGLCALSVMFRDGLEQMPDLPS
jgi:hypothetical protein